MTGTFAPRSCTWSYRSIALIGSIIAFSAFGFAFAQPASAHSSISNGCTTPVHIPYWNDRFHPQCDTHDRCYNQKWYGTAWWGKAPCDARFYNEMLGNCGWNVLCRSVAYRYYAAVRDFGWYAWYNSSWFH